MSQENALSPQAVAALLAQERLTMTGRLLKGLVHNISGGLQLMRLPLDMLELKLTQGPLATEDLTSKLEILQQGLSKVGEEVELLAARASQQNDLQPRPLRLPQLISEQLAFWRSDMFFKHEVELNHEPAPARLRATIAYADLALALNALLANALESLQASGRRRLWVSYSETAASAGIQVADDGPGPDPAIAPLMFDPFTGDKGPSHAGLGLFLAAQALAPWGGRVEWTPGPRPCFSLVLPAQEP